jgi:uncharacterized membrane protein YccC
VTAGNKQPSQWLELVQRLERTIGEPIEAFVGSDAYFDLMTQVKRARGRLARSFEGVAAEWLHLFNIPAATDVRRLREQLSRLERQVDRIAKDLADREEERREEAASTAAKPRAPRTAKRKSSRTSGS